MIVSTQQNVPTGTPPNTKLSCWNYIFINDIPWEILFEVSMRCVSLRKISWILCRTYAVLNYMQFSWSHSIHQPYRRIRSNLHHRRKSVIWLVFCIMQYLLTTDWTLWVWLGPGLGLGLKSGQLFGSRVRDWAQLSGSHFDKINVSQRNNPSLRTSHQRKPRWNA